MEFVNTRNWRQIESGGGAPTRRVLKLNLERLVRVVVRPDVHLDGFAVDIKPCWLGALVRL